MLGRFFAYYRPHKGLFLPYGTGALRPPEQMPESPRHLGQFLRPDDEQGNHADDHEFGKADIEHRNVPRNRQAGTVEVVR